MTKLIKYFIDNSSLNHTLLLFLLVSGIYAYVKIPKEIFPDVTLNMILVSGAYSGASASTLDKMAVRDIEDDVSSISGISKIESAITPGKFSIVLTLDENADGITVLNKVKDAIATIRQNLPPDMNEPVATLLDKNRDLVKLSMASSTLDFEALLESAKEVKSRLSKIAHISEVEIYGDSDKKVELRIDENALRAYNISASDVISAVKNLSYIFPIGDIDDKENFIFVSTVNGKGSLQEWENTLLQIGGQHLYLKDIADVHIYHPRDITLSTFNGTYSLSLKIMKDNEGNAITLSKELREYVDKLSERYPQITFDFYQDTSEPIDERLSIIIANLTLGLILIFLTMYLLINRNTALVVTMGVPFAFIIGLLFIYYGGYSLNMVSLIGALLVVGIAVDDAVVVSENIQRHIDEGMSPAEAAIAGVREVFLPITMATLTTVAAFLPMFMMSGEMGLFIKLIPIVVVMVLIGSLLESFFFLPLHAKTLLKKGTPSLNWKPATDRYEKILHRLIHYKKTTLLLFFVLVPLATFGTLKLLHFQFFPSFDGGNINITAKMNINTTLEETYAVANRIEKELLAQKEALFIKSISTLSGKRRSLSNSWDTGTNLFYISIALEDQVPQNWVNHYINPILDFSFVFNDPEKIRTLPSFEIANRMREKLAPLKEAYGVDELAVMEQKPGIVKTDIELNLIGSDDTKIEDAVARLESRLQEIDGVNDVVDNIRYGKMEYKIRLNSYGEQLGLSEAEVASVLSSYFLGSRKTQTFGEEGVIDVTTEYRQKDRIATLSEFDIPLGDGRTIKLHDVADFVKVQGYEIIEKENGEIVKTVSANVDKKMTTATEVLQQLQPLIEAIEGEGIEVNLLGEKEKNEQLKSDMRRAVVVSLFIMLILLLLIFPKIKYALMILSVIPFSIFGALFGHLLMGINITMPSIIGILGLAGVVINDGIIMLDFLHGTHDVKSFYYRAKLRLRPIIITSVTTFVGLSTLMFFASGQAVIMQPLAISLGFGLLWGTVMNLFYLPTLYGMVNRIHDEPGGQNGGTGHDFESGKIPENQKI
jgi:HAE1 family hydrophobic/amphiphilic exporter-1